MGLQLFSTRSFKNWLSSTEYLKFGTTIYFTISTRNSKILKRAVRLELNNYLISDIQSLTPIALHFWLKVTYLKTLKLKQWYAPIFIPFLLQYIPGPSQ